MVFFVTKLKFFPWTGISLPTASSKSLFSLLIVALFFKVNCKNLLLLCRNVVSLAVIFFSFYFSANGLRMNFKVIKTDLVGWVLACNLLVEDLKGKKKIT